ncbi:MAG: hypothetical protein WDW38_009145 [Sanguina aurantia]
MRRCPPRRERDAPAHHGVSEKRPLTTASARCARPPRRERRSARCSPRREREAPAHHGVSEMRPPTTA